MNVGSSRSIAHISLFAALVVVLGLVPKIDLPFGVPVTAQTLGVMLAGCLLGAKRGFLAMLLVLGGVALGLPLLSGGRGGIGVFASPTAGYLLAWPFGALVAGLAMRFVPGPVWARGFVASAIGGIAVIHLSGIAGLVLLAKMEPVQAALADLAFVPGDLIKCVLVAALVQTVARGLPDWQAHRA
jgi:biotin transport system substrate-specific component